MKVSITVMVILLLLSLLTSGLDLLLGFSWQIALKNLFSPFFAMGKTEITVLLFFVFLFIMNLGYPLFKKLLKIH